MLAMYIKCATVNIETCLQSGNNSVKYSSVVVQSS